MLKDLCFEIIQTCPNNCLFCSSNASITQKKIINLSIFKQTIDYLIEQGGIEEISISGGEPFLHPDIFQMVEYCKEKNIRTIIFTSGIKQRKKLTNQELKIIKKQIQKQYEHFLKEGLPIEQYNHYVSRDYERIVSENNLSFDAISKEEFQYLKFLGLDKIVFDFQAWNQPIYNKIMGTENYFDYLKLSTIRASSADLNMDVHFIPTKLNYKELPDLIEMLNVVNCPSLSILNFVPQGRGLKNQSLLTLNQTEYQEFIQIYQQFKNYFKGTIRIGIPLSENDQHKCTAGLSKMIIKYDGTVLPCPAFKEYPLENLHQIGIKTPNIYTELEKVQIYEGTRETPLCKKLYKFNQHIQ